MPSNWTLTMAVAVAVVSLTTTMYASGDEDVYKVEAYRNKHREPRYCPPRDPKNRTIHLPDETDCTKFYKCDHGKRVPFECPYMDHQGHRLHFNPILEVCDWPWHAGCDDTIRPPPPTPTPTPTTSDKSTEGKSHHSTKFTTGSSTKGGGSSSDEHLDTPTPGGGIPCDGNTITDGTLVPHECICQKYYVCSNGNLILQKCPEGLDFNPKIRVCDYPDSAGCRSTTLPLPVTEKSTTTTIIPSQCPPNDTDPPVKFPHPTNCSLYYKCENGKKILLQCPNGLHFSPSVGMCDWPDTAGCVSSSSTTTTTTTSDDAHRTSPSSLECPPDNSGPIVQLPHPYNCSLFYVCDNGEKLVHSCPPGFEFNADKRVCDLPESSGCSTSGTTLPETTSTIPDNDRCPPADDSGSAAVHLPHPTNCSLFYQCDHGQKILRLCPPPLEFNAWKQVCDWPELAGCSSISTTTTGYVEQCPPDNSGPVVQLPYPYNCSLYYLCDDGNKVLRSCPPGFEFNARKQVCDDPESSGCSAENPDDTTTITTQIPESECPPDAHGLRIPHETNCSLYYECNGGEKIIKECTPGLDFSPTLELCVWPANAGCRSDDDRPNAMESTTL